MATHPVENAAQRHRVKSSHQRQKDVVSGVLTAWAMIVTFYFLWETIAYRGLYARLSEWQFEQFGHYLPMLTISILIFIFASPALWLARLAPETKNRRSTADQARLVSYRFSRILFGVSGALAVAALGTFLWTFTLPTLKAPQHHIVVGQGDKIDVAPGPATLSGTIVYTRTSAFTQQILFKRRGVRFAPVIAPGQPAQSIRFFTELAPSDAFVTGDIRPVSTRAGILERNALPGSIVRLYRYAGYKVENPYFVLYTSQQTLRWPYYLTAIQLLVASLVVLIAALLQYRHVRSLDEELPERSAVLESISQ
jgi:hypothetical protein